MKPVTRLGVLAAAGLAAEAAYAVYQDLPTFEGADASGTFGDPSAPAVTITVLGDSSCTGPGLTDLDDIWIRRIARRLADRYHVRLDSLAVGGSTARDVLVDQVPNVRRSDVAIVAVGGNDVMRVTPLVHLQHDLDRIVDALSPLMGQVLLSGVGDVGAMPRLPFAISKLATVASAYADRAHHRAAASRPNVTVLPNRDQTTEPFRTDRDLWAADLMHANARGHRLWADVAYPYVEAAVTN